MTLDAKMDGIKEETKKWQPRNIGTFAVTSLTAPTRLYDLRDPHGLRKLCTVPLDEFLSYPSSHLHQIPPVVLCVSFCYVESVLAI